MGFTARAALDRVAADAEVVVVEAVAQVIAWNRDPGLLGQLAGMPLGDPRLSVVEGDVGDVIERTAAATTEAARFDAILLDVDNGPTALSTFTNRRLYTVAGLASARQALRSDGVLAVWSTFADARFTARLHEAGFVARTMRVLAGDGTSRRHILWLARPVRRSLGLGSRGLEPEEISNARHDGVVDQPRTDELRAGPGEQPDATDRPGSRPPASP